MICSLLLLGSWTGTVSRADLNSLGHPRLWMLVLNVVLVKKLLWGMKIRWWSSWIADLKRMSRIWFLTDRTLDLLVWSHLLPFHRVQRLLCSVVGHISWWFFNRFLDERTAWSFWLHYARFQLLVGNTLFSRDVEVLWLLAIQAMQSVLVIQVLRGIVRVR